MREMGSGSDVSLAESGSCEEVRVGANGYSPKVKREMKEENECYGDSLFGG